MNLFSMSDAQLNAAVERHYDYLYNKYFDTDEPDPCCKNCDNYSLDGICRILEDNLSEAEAEEMDATEDYSAIEKDENDYCDNWEPKEVFPKYDPDN